MRQASLRTNESPVPLADSKPQEDHPAREHSWPRSSAWGRWRKRLYKWCVEPFVTSQHPPWFDARAVSVGLVVGFGVPLSLQCVSLGLLRLVFRFNLVVAFLFTWVNNPFTIIPMYYGYYYLGSLVLGLPPILSMVMFQDLMRPVSDAGYFWASIKAFASLGLDFLIRWSVGALMVAAVAGPLGYLMGYYFQRNRCKRRARELGLTYEQLLANLEKNIATGKNQ